MTSPNQPPVRLTFGPFEVNTSTGELLKGGSRVRLPAQPFQPLDQLYDSDFTDSRACGYRAL